MVSINSNNLFSPNISTRYAASLEYGQKHPALFYPWPRGCWGAANGWLMLCGPSPGRADAPSLAVAGGPNRPKDAWVRIGEDAGKIDFDSNKARNKRWRKMVYSVFGDEAIGSCLTSVANLDWGNYGNHRDIPASHLEEGCTTVFEVMQASKPGVVTTLVTVTWDYLTSYLAEHLSNPSSPVPAVAGRKPLKCHLLQIPNCSHKTLLLKSPQHPSRHFFTDIHCQQIETTVNWFIETYL